MRAARSSRRGLPPLGLGGSSGNSDSTISQSSSLTNSLAILLPYPDSAVLKGSLRIIGPGLVLAATTVGIGDFISNAVAGERYGMTFAWAIVLAVVLKYFLTEGLGRWHLASGQTIIYGWNSLGRGMTVFVAVYLVIWAFFFGAAGPSVVGLATNAMFPILSVPAWAVVHSLVAFLFVWVGRYLDFSHLAV